MAISISELIAQKDSIKEKKSRKYTIETSIGEILVKPPSASVAAESFKLRSENEGDSYLIINCVLEPNLKSEELQKAFECAEPLEIVAKIFAAGEISAIAGCLLRLAGYSDKRLSAKLFDEVKN